ncbi:sensor histidine kinase [Gordonia sp. NPDC003422]
MRIFSMFVSVGYLIYGVLCIPLIIAAVPLAATWWTVAAVILTLGTGLAMGALSWRADIPRIRIVSGTACVGFLLATALWWPAWNGNLISTVQGIWFAQFPGLAAIAAVIAVRTSVGFVVLAILVVNTVLADNAVHEPGATGSLIGDLAWGYVFSMVFVAAAGMGLRAARILDATRAEAYAATAAAAAEQARAVERGRFNALTHDSLMSTLLVAARHGSSPELAEEARKALGAISVDEQRPPAEVVPWPVFVETIRDLNPDITIAGETGPLPGAVAEALTLATAEAVRNAQRHAGADARVTISVTATPDGVRIVIADDGVGFDPNAVAPARLGIALSIRGRMQMIDGAAEINSSPGTGTEVVLTWSR